MRMFPLTLSDGIARRAGSREPYLPPLRIPVRRIGARTFDFSRQVAVMAVVNRTPDSFYDRGRTFALDAAVAAVLRAVADGADWVDIGGAPFAPGRADPGRRGGRARRAGHRRAAGRIGCRHLGRHLPRRGRPATPSAPGPRSSTTRPGSATPRCSTIVADSEATLVITHSLAAPRTQYPRPHYDDVAAEVAAFLARARRPGDGMPACRRSASSSTPATTSTRTRCSRWS